MDKVIEIDPIQDTRWDAFVNKAHPANAGISVFS